MTHDSGRQAGAQTEMVISPEMERKARYILGGFDRDRDDPESALRDSLLGLFEGSAFLIRFDSIREEDAAA